MNYGPRSNDQSQRIGRYMLILMLAWTFAVAASVYFSLKMHRQAFYSEVYAQARGIDTMDMEYRNWAISHGGVYVPVDEHTPPSKYLKDIPERDVITPSGRQLTLLNSSYMTRQVHELMDRHDAPLRGHIASLKPFNPVNKADPWEVGALKAFEQGKKEVAGIEKMADGKSYFRFMQPMVTEKSCLKCHVQQGYKVGDIRGGISVSIPVDEPLAIENHETVTLMTGHGVIWLLGLAGIFIGGRRQQQSLQLVEKSEAEVRLLANSIAHAIYGQDLNGKCTFANAACVQLLGYGQESELLGKDIHAMMHHTRADGNPYPATECPTHKSIREGKSFHIDEEIFWRRDGSSFPVAYWSYPVMRGGQCVGAVVTFLDITEQKRVSGALKQSQKLLDSIVEHIPSMLFLKNAEDLRFERINRAGEQMLGYSREDLLGKNDFDFFPREQAEFFAEKDKAVLDSHEVAEVSEEPIRTADGQQKWLHTFKIGLYDDEERPTHLLGISMDITGRKRAETTLRESRHNLAEAQRMAHIGSWKLDLVNDKLFWSEEIYRIFEIDSQQFAASYEAFLQAIHPEDREAVNKAFSDSLSNGEPYQIDHRLLMPDGRIKYVLERGETSYDESGKPLCSSGTVQDISERKQAEISLEHANRALQALSTVNRELVHATEEEALLQAICTAVVEQKDYRMAWVGYVQHDAAKSIRHMACAGDEHDILAGVHPGWAEDEDGTGPSGRAVRTGKTQLSRDIANDPKYPSWKGELIRQGCVSSIALPLAAGGKVFGILHVYADEVDAFTAREVDLLEEMAADLAFGVNSLRIRLERDSAMAQNEQHLARMHESLAGTVNAIARAVEVRDPYTAGHQRRVASLACAIAASMGLDDNRIEGIRMGAMIHDIGKIQVPAEILTKPTKLSDIEYAIIREHPGVGFEILKDIHFPWPVANIAYQHHERMDGSGYPQGLKEEEICLEARIVAVADVVEAMASHRPYRASLGIDKALAEIRQNRGILYDTVAADTCLKLFAEGNFSLEVD
ncbi:PAS domain S-box protein [Mariprofundus ferrooxydans]|uniref:PAS domain S-box protein n=1 Tax=Mariprofundus ferrooxydans TaxID=314344 RepID=UPI0014315C7D|nr:HD domain-containing phosphohydrolase [Mariprofundus ferrooxydans]